MLDITTENAIQEALDAVSNVSRLDPELSTRLIADFAAKYVADTAATWWWTSLQVPFDSVDYGENAGISLIEALLDKLPEVAVTITDDEWPPWPILMGTGRDICDFIAELPCVEYFAFSSTMNWAVFDTHHNSLVLVGEFVRKASELRKLVAASQAGG
ncbi:MAG: hypothetical protein NTX56_18855 [Proteobacteria bacterium]|nr:hypothetical protein [Pseudomonadota bacterium]